tara:strand:+ start:17311 stop:25050 length:7740 start_codon:yes stop_codon:yes gene_type:complete
MSLKKLFKNKAESGLNKAPSQQINVSSSFDVESFDAIKQKADFDKKIFAFVDISASLGNYVRYGLAEEHYATSIKRIYQDYPYDGTQAEKYKFLNDSNTFDYYIWKDKYPKTTGYITLNEGQGTSVEQRVEIKAGPNLNNVYRAASNQTNNLEFDATHGATVEFWAKPTGSAFAGGMFETVDSAGNFFCVFLNNSGGTGVQLIVQKSSSAGGVEANTTFSTLADHDANWHHYALTFELNASDKLVSTLYVDGAYTEQKTDSNTVTTTVNAVSGNVGFAQTYFFTGSVDDFRYWKGTRTAREIGLNWNTHVDGGTNNKSTIPRDLGLYLKFNEGITTVDSTDSKVLDYSGRVASASILNYATGMRSTNSAIQEYSSEYYEVPDPIIYSFHPSVAALESTGSRDGKAFDNDNNHSFYQIMPAWIREQDNNELRYLSHIIGAYFDELYAQISTFEKVKDKNFQDQDLKIFPYYRQMLESHGFDTDNFLVGSDLLSDLNEKTLASNLVSGSISDLKNTIYRNIYNNMLFLYKSKGTQDSIRNLLNCYGVNQNMFRMRNYSNFTTSDIANRDQLDVFEDKSIDFYGLKNFIANKQLPNESTIFNFTSSDSNNQAFVTADLGKAFSIESSVYFPVQAPSNSDFYFGYDVSGSLFGVHAANALTASDATWHSADVVGMSAYAVHDGKTDRHAKFVLSSSNGKFTAVESDIYEVYDNTNWNLAIVVEPEGDARNLPTSISKEYVARLIGYQVDSGQTINSFNITSSIGAATGTLMLAESKRVFVGAERTNFTGSVVYKSQARIGNCKFYADSLEEEEVFLHAKYKNSEGRLRPFENANRKNDNDTEFVPQYLTKIFEWDFEQVTQPNSLGQFEVSDTTSASLSLANGFAGYGTAVSKLYNGFGFSFPTGTNSYEKEFVSKYLNTLPDESTAANVVNAEGESTIVFQPNEAPTRDAVLLAKSMYEVISSDILKSFAGVTDFNYLIGNPVNKYRVNYKDMEGLRRLYFESVENSPELEKFVEYFQWLDGVIESIIENMLPATTNLVSEATNVVESHVLERSKYPLKYPTLEFKSFRPTGSIDSIVSMANVASRTSLLNDRRAGAAGSFNFASSSVKTPNYVNVEELGATILSGNVKPVLITNRPFVTASNDERTNSAAPRDFATSTVGNFREDYEVVQAVGQKGALGGKYLEIEQQGSSLTNSEFLSGVVDYSIPARNKYKSIIRGTFNAPGSPETMGGGLDKAAREFSVYNSLNFRNLTVRDPLNVFYKTPSAFGGLQSGSTKIPSYHKIARNGYTRKEFSGSSIVDKKVFDNAFVQTQLPATDLQYAWIAESYKTADINRYQTSSQFAPNEQIAFLTSTIRNFETAENYLINFSYITTPGDFASEAGYHYELEPSTNKIIAPTNYSSVAGLADNVDVFFLNVNGPYGFPSWRAYRKDAHPIVRDQRTKNVYSYVTSSKLVTRDGVLNINSLTHVTQSAVSITEPIFIQLKDTSFDIKSTFENQKLGFTNIDLQVRQAPFEKALDNKITFLDKVNNEEDLEISRLTVRSNIYPKTEFQFLNKTRTRDVFDNKWWRSDRGDRQQTLTSNVYGFTFSSFAGKEGTPFQSRWSMDARDDFATSTPETDSEDPGTAAKYGPNNPSGSGILQNSYTTFHFYPDDIAGGNLKYGPLYARRTIEPITTTIGLPLPGVITTAVTGGILNTGEALWEVGSQSGKEPFYNSYAEYAEVLRIQGKDYSIVPEFRLDDHIETYLSNGFDFKTQLADFFSLTGSSDTSIAQRYSAAELSDVLGTVQEDTDLGVKRFGLKAKALLKLLPYEGFYPQQRTVQMAKELSSSYIGTLETFTNDGLSFKNPKQFFFEPYVTPGILFNTIKSGLAVDYPLFKFDDPSIADFSRQFCFIQTGSTQVVNGNTFFGDAITDEFVATSSAAVMLEVTGGILTGDAPHSSSFPYLNRFVGIGPSFEDVGGAVDRVPFEAMLDPYTEFKEKYVQYDPNNLATNTGSFSLVGSKPKINHSLFANNFFAETVNFFLKRGLVSFESLAKDTFTFDTTKEYEMVLSLTNADVSSVREYAEKSIKNIPGIAGTDPIKDVFADSTASLEPEKNCVMYDRSDAFGFPLISTAYTGSDSGKGSVSTRKFSSFTPPYYNGFARAKYTFQPTKEQHTLDEIVSKMTISYLRANENPYTVLLEDQTFVNSLQAPLTMSQLNADMQISSSFVVDAVVEEKKTKFNEDGDVIEFESFDTPRKKLVIHSKYECPVLNFKDVSITRPAEGSTTAPKGMWHQYGEIPNYSDTGIFAELADGFTTRGAPTASLADALGMKKQKRAIGQLATSREVEEALVVLPYYTDPENPDEKQQFFDFNPNLLSTILDRANNPSVKNGDDQIIRQIRLMKKYIFPPFMDFVTFPNEENVKKPLMYIFEFGRTLSQEDLANIWQGVLPDAGLTTLYQESVIDLDTNYANFKPQDVKGLSATNPAQTIVGNIQTLLASEDSVVLNSGNKTLDEINLLDLNFFVFKVKKRAEFEYSKITKNTTDDQFQFDFKATGFEADLPFFKEFGRNRLAYSYNYPYDFFSLIELAKVDAQIELGEDEE